MKRLYSKKISNVKNNVSGFGLCVCHGCTLGCNNTCFGGCYKGCTSCSGCRDGCTACFLGTIT